MTTETLANDRSVANAMRRLRAMREYHVLLQKINDLREQVIEEGKRGRAEEKQRRMWAVLDGIDRVALLPEKLEKQGDEAGEVVDVLEDL